MKRILFITSGIFLFLFSCKQEQEQEHITTTPKTLLIKPYKVPGDSVTEAKVVIAGKPVEIKTGKPIIVPTNINVHAFEEPESSVYRSPDRFTPGVDTFLLPKTVKAVEHLIPAGIPETVIAKDAYTKDQNPESFSFYGKLQGLKQSNINCMMQDKIGNIWFGTFGGGACKYDGRTFTHYTEKEGLCNNDIWCILEDNDGNIWFGSWGKGISKYDGRTFTNYTKAEGLSSNIVLDILQDKNKNIWLATYDGGINKYDGKAFTWFTIKQGLVSNQTSCIEEDKNGNLWFGTVKGISKYN